MGFLPRELQGLPISALNPKPEILKPKLTLNPLQKSSGGLGFSGLGRAGLGVLDDLGFRSLLVFFVGRSGVWGFRVQGYRALGEGFRVCFFTNGLRVLEL